MVLSYHDAQSEFDEVEKTGGEKTHTLTIAELPAHNHQIGGNNFQFVGRNSTSTGSSEITSSGTRAVEGANSTQNRGSGNAHNNLQPYTTCYMFKRVS